MNDEYLNDETTGSLPVLTVSESKVCLHQSLMNVLVAQTEAMGAVANLGEAALRENADVSEFADKVGTTLDRLIESMTGMSVALKEIRDFGGPPSA